MSKAYFLLLCSFLISAKAVASDEEARVDVSDNACASAATSSEEILLNTRPEEMLLHLPQIGMKEIMLAGLAVEFKSFIKYVNGLREGGKIPYTDISKIKPSYNGNLATLLFHRLILVYRPIFSYHEEMNNSDTSYIVNVYRERMRFLLSDKDKGVNVNQQIENGANFLMIAASNGHDDIVELLLERGADLSYRPVDGQFQNQTVLTVTRQALNRYENQPLNEMSRDPEHIRVKKIERYNRTIVLLEEAGANTVFGYFRSWFRR